MQKVESTLETVDIDTGARSIVLHEKILFEAPNWSSVTIQKSLPEILNPLFIPCQLPEGLPDVLLNYIPHTGTVGHLIVRK